VRFISKFPRLGLRTARREATKVAADGFVEIVQPSLIVQFEQHSLVQSDIDAAAEHWPEKAFTGRYVDEDRITLQPVAERIGVLDTVEEQKRRGWSDEERELVEQYMLGKDNIGTDFIAIEAKLAPLPWPTYAAKELGLVSEALAYELENENRETVVKALEAAEQVEELVSA